MMQATLGGMPRGMPPSVLDRLPDDALKTSGRRGPTRGERLRRSVRAEDESESDLRG
jgi:hypothetical protein